MYVTVRSYCIHKKPPYTIHHHVIHEGHPVLPLSLLWWLLDPSAWTILIGTIPLTLFLVGQFPFFYGCPLGVTRRRPLFTGTTKDMKLLLCLI